MNSEYIQNIFLKMFNNSVFSNTIDTTLRIDYPDRNLYSLRKVGFARLNERIACAKEDHIAYSHNKKTKYSYLDALQLIIPNVVLREDGITGVLPSGKEMIHLTCDPIHIMNKQFYCNLHQKISLLILSNKTMFSSYAITQDVKEHTTKLLDITQMNTIEYCANPLNTVFDRVSSRGKKYIVHFSESNKLEWNNIHLDPMSDKSVEFIQGHQNNIAAVIVDPLYVILHAGLFSIREREHCSKWLKRIQDVCKCTKSPIAFVLDDRNFALRTPDLFSFRYFKVGNVSLSPDMIILGNGIAAGCPLNVLLGNGSFTQNNKGLHHLDLDDEFSTWQIGIIASNVFLDAIENQGGVFETMIERISVSIQRLNGKLAGSNLPLRIRNFSNVISFTFLKKSVFNHLLFQYLVAEGIFMSNTESNYFYLSDEWTNDDLLSFENKVFNAVTQMNNDGFFELGRNIIV